MADELTGVYLASRESSVVPPSQRRRMETAPDEALSQDESREEALGTIVETTGDIVKDVGKGIIELPNQVVGGMVDAVNNAALALESVIPLGTLGGDEFTEETAMSPKDPESTTGGLVRGVSQFLTGFLPALKATKAIGITGRITSAMAAGAVTDAIVFDPQEERLSNLIEGTPLANPVTEFLAASEDDSDALGRFKSAVEGLGLGGLAEGVITAIKVMRQARRVKGEQAQIEADRATADALASDTGKDLNAIEATEGPLPTGTVEGEFIPFQEKMGDAAAPDFAIGSKGAEDEGALNINLSKIDSTEDVDRLIQGVAESDSVKINEARREVITLEETTKLADSLGMTVDDLLNRRRGEAFNAEQAVAARNILVSSGENLIDLAKVAATGSDEDVAIFRRAMAQHGAIQAQVSGLTAEAGRALGSFRIMAESSQLQTRAIKEALDAGGGGDVSRRIAEGLSQLDDPRQINDFVTKSAGARTLDAVYEAWINSLLSSPATHAVNMIGNSMNVLWAVSEKKVASLIGRGLDEQSIPDGEMAAQMFGMVQGTKDGMRLAWQALKTGQPSDPLAKIETIGHRAISAEALELSGTPGRFADYMGEAVRIPGRMLTAGDELFKTIGYRMELNSQAYRMAHGEGLRGDELAVRMNDLISNPPDNLHIQAVDASRYQTFTKPLGPSGQAVQSFVQRTPGARLIAPFIRTPVNIMKYVGERSPLAPISTAVRAEIAAGGARRDMALAKIATGSMIMAAAADYAGSGQITGAGPVDPAMRNILRETGWQPYSFKVGDTYYAYSRLDPVGATIGMAADMTEIMGQTGEFDSLDMAAALVISVSQNITSKTYLSGVADFFEVMTNSSTDPEANNRKAQRWIERMAGTVIPSGVAQLERTLSPELNATQGIIEKIKSRVPGYSADLPPRRNIFGEPIVLSGGLGPDIMSPIYTSSVKDNPVADEIVAQQARIRMPLKSINGVQLDTRQYDEYIRLYSGESNRFVQMPLKQKLSELFRTPQYQSATLGQEGGRSVLIRATFEAYRDAAKAAMIENNPDLQMNIMRLQTQKAERLTGQ